MLGRLRRKSWVVYVEKVICQCVELGRLHWKRVDLLKSVMSRSFPKQHPTPDGDFLQKNIPRPEQKIQEDECGSALG